MTNPFGVTGVVCKRSHGYDAVLSIDGIGEFTVSTRHTTHSVAHAIAKIAEAELSAHLGLTLQTWLDKRNYRKAKP